MLPEKRRCAFCREQKKLSREHVFPNGVIQKMDEDILSVNDKVDKVFKSDLVVKDVCEACNNGVLSDVDRRFVKIFENNMLHPLQPGDNAEFEFDYNDLLRGLLKISYNSARASVDGSKAVAALKKYVPYVLGKAESAPEVTLRLQIVTSSNVFNCKTNKVEGTMDAELLRSCKVSYNGPHHSKFLIRLLAFNSFWFYLFIPLKPVSASKRKAFIDGFRSSFHLAGVPVLESMSSISIPKEKTTYMDPSLVEGMRRGRA